MIAACGQGPHTGGLHGGKECSDVFDLIVEVEPVAKVHIAKVAHGAQLKRIDTEFQIECPHKTRSIADLPGAVSGTSAVGNSQIRGHTNEADIDASEISCERRAHERRYFREAWL